MSAYFFDIHFAERFIVKVGHDLNIFAKNLLIGNILSQGVKTGQRITRNNPPQPANDIAVIIVFGRFNKDNVELFLAALMSRR